MGHFARKIALTAAFGLFAQAASAQGDATQRTSLDLDGRLPPEQVEDMGGYKRVLFWSVENGMWLEIFRTRGISGLIDDGQSYFRRIVSDGRQWQWRNEGFVPLVVNEAVAAGATSNADFQAAVSLFAADLPELPANSPANMTFLYKPEDGEPLKAVRLATSSICAVGGSSCPLVVLNPGQDARAIYIDLDSTWGFHEAGGRVYVEYQEADGVVQVDLGTGAETRIDMIAPVIAKAPPKEPRHVE